MLNTVLYSDESKNYVESEQESVHGCFGYNEVTNNWHMTTSLLAKENRGGDRKAKQKAFMNLTNNFCVIESH